MKKGKDFRYGTPCTRIYTIKNINTVNVMIAENMTRSMTKSDPGVFKYDFAFCFNVISLLLTTVPPVQ